MERRKFLKLNSGLLVGGILGNGLLQACANPIFSKRNTFGIQLYTLREDMPKDPKSVLKQIASFGYQQIESYEGPMGMFWGMSNKEFKKYLDELQLNIVSSHCNVFENFESKANQAAEIGMKYLICPWLGPQKTLDDFKKAADKFNECGTIAKKAGIRFAYHNHDYSFKLLENQKPQDVLMKNTDPDLVDFEMDIYWVVTAGEDPILWMKEYKNRFTLCHIKDRIKNTNEAFASCTLGEGGIDFQAIVSAGKKYGMKYHIVEQERYDGTTPLKAVEENAEYMKHLRM